MKLHVLVVCIVLVACAAILANAADEAEEVEQQGKLRLWLQLPNLFNFQRFKEMFDKHYNSLAEEMVRQKIVLGRAFRAFISMVKYNYGQMNYYLSVNVRSDWTPEEREKSKVEPEKMISPDVSNLKVIEVIDESATPTSEPFSHVAPSVATLGAADQVPVAELEDIERQLAEIESKKDEPGYKELAEELEKMRHEKLARRKRDVEGQTRERHVELSADDLMHPNKAELSPETRRKMQYRVPSNNPNYEPPELSSSAAGDEGEWSLIRPLSDTVIKTLSNLSGAQYVRNVVESSLGSNEKGKVIFGKANVRRGNKVYIDLRDSNCFHPARDQGLCGSCYSFAAIAFHEYLFCMETGTLVAFSEQYMVDCGYRFGLGGCQGGRLDYATEFVERFGLELRPDYPYRERHDTCPYEQNVEQHHMGRVRTLDSGSGLVMLAQFDGYLAHFRRPIVFCVKTSIDFDDYGGGVDMGVQCEKGEAHAMLIIGHGRQDGQEYYLFRNSHSISWGEQGYIKLAKSVMDRCACSNYGFVSTGHYRKPIKELINTKYNGEAVRNRLRNYLRQIV